MAGVDIDATKTLPSAPSYMAWWLSSLFESARRFKECLPFFYELLVAIGASNQTILFSDLADELFLKLVTLPASTELT